jgi:hypothetical protein
MHFARSRSIKGHDAQPGKNQPIAEIQDFLTKPLANPRLFDIVTP